MTRPPKRTPQRRPVTPEDLLRFRIVSDPQIAPDGTRIVFVEKHAGERNEYVSNLWMVETGRSSGAFSRRAGGPPRRLAQPWQFTEGGKDHTPRWSPDGRRIAFVREAERGSPQIHIIGLAGGEALPLTSFPEGALGTFAWSPDGSWLAVSFRPQDPARTAGAEKERRRQGLSDPPRVIDDLFYRFDGDGFLGDRRHRLYLVDARSGRSRELYAQDTLGTFTFDFSPDSRQLVVSTNRAKQPTLHPWKDELLRINLATGRVTRIPGLPPGPKTAVRWSPDGRTIAYAGRTGTDPAYSVENLDLFVCHPVRGGGRNLTAAADLCLQAEGLTDTAVNFGGPLLHFTPDSARVFMRLSVRGESHVASVPVGGGRLAFHTRGPLDVRLGNVSADGRTMALTVGDAVTLAEVAVGDCRRVAAKPQMLSNLNGPLLAELAISTPEMHWVRGEGGQRVQVWVVRPPKTGGNGASRKKFPAVLEIHGGPHAQYCSSFFHEFQVMAAAGYTVFYSNPRGSKGYGRDHCAAIRGQWGTADWADLQAVIRFIQADPRTDARRLGVIGGSYGGYMVNWAISHCRDFVAAVTDRSLSNLVSFSGTTDWIEPPGHYFPGNFWDRSEARWEQSPLKYARAVQTPTLVIHSEGDLRCGIEQAEQFYAALRVLGVPAQFVRYPAATSHGMSRGGPPDLRIDRLHRILAWWRKYLDRLTHRRNKLSQKR